MSLHFGTAGVRAPLGDGPDRLNPGTVRAVVIAVARHLREAHPAGSTVVVGGDARHGSAGFVRLAAAVLRDHGLVPLTPGEPVPTPVVAAAVRSRGAVAGLQVTASHNPATDNGIKLYGADGAQIVPPTDARIEELLSPLLESGVAVPDVPSADPDPGADPTLVDDYVAAVTAALTRIHRPLRVALTPVHGVGGEVCRRVLARIGIDDVVVVPEQAVPDPDFPTVAAPNPEHPATVARLLEVAAGCGADVAIALDPDADRCAVGTRGPDGRWRMLDGDDTGALLADHLLRTRTPGEDSPTPVVASTLVSSRLPSLLVPARGGRHVVTPTGFKWLVRAGEPLLYAYEEAIGHCVSPGIVADKDGMSAAGAWCALVADLAADGRTVTDRLAELHAEFGTHVRRNSSVRLDPGSDPAALLDRVSQALASDGSAVSPLEGATGVRVDVTSADGAGARAILRPSGTEPLLKLYCEAWTPPETGPSGADSADRLLAELVARVSAAVDR